MGLRGDGERVTEEATEAATCRNGMQDSICLAWIVRLGLFDDGRAVGRTMNEAVPSAVPDGHEPIYHDLPRPDQVHGLHRGTNQPETPRRFVVKRDPSP